MRTTAAGTFEDPHVAPRKTESYTWSFPGAPIRIVVDLAVIRKIRIQIDQQHGTATGLLLGVVVNRTVHVTGVRQLASLDADEFSAALTLTRAGADRMPVGYYAADSRVFLKLSPDEAGIVHRLFQAPDSVVLLVQNGEGTVPNASFFFWDSDKFVSDFGFLEFPFDADLLRSEMAARPTASSCKSPEEQLLAQPVEHGNAPAKKRHRLWHVAFAGVLLVVGCATAAMWPSVVQFEWTRPPQRNVPHGASELGFKAEPSAGDFRLSWDRQSTIVTNAESGTLYVRDGDNTTEVHLKPDELTSGSVFLRTRNSQIDVRFTLVMPDHRTHSESVILLLPGVAQTNSEHRPYGRVIDMRDHPRAANPRQQMNPVEPSRAPITRGIIGQLAAGSGPASPDQLRSEDVAASGVPPAAPKPDLSSSVSVQPAADKQSLGESLRLDLPVSASRMRGISAIGQVAATAEESSPSTTTAPSTTYTAAVPISRPIPALTDMVRALLKGETTVSVRVLVDPRGVVTRAEVEPMSNVNDYVATVARNAAMLWRFRPAERNGRPVGSKYMIGFKFKPER